MDKEAFVKSLELAVSRITNPRYFETERGYQGALVAELTPLIANFDSQDAIVEQEYQKRMRQHGVTIRPDIIIHVPFNPDIHNSRGDGNFVIIELKLNASRKASLADYDSIEKICMALNYPLGIFINISSNNTYLDEFIKRGHEDIIGFATRLEGDEVVLVRNSA